jgi:hypothetical protein
MSQSWTRAFYKSEPTKDARAALTLGSRSHQLARRCESAGGESVRVPYETDATRRTLSNGCDR